MTNIKFYYYSIPNDKYYSGWAKFILASNGMVAVCSDYVNGAGMFTTEKTDIRKFILETIDEGSTSYINRIMFTDEFKYDWEDTLKSIKEHIIYEFREGNWNKEKSRDEWNLAEYHLEGINDEFGFYNWYDETNIRDAGELHCKKYSEATEEFWKYCMPKLAEMIRAELKEEDITCRNCNHYKESRCQLQL
jgi:hypothetical protein